MALTPCNELGVIRAKHNRTLLIVQVVCSERRQTGSCYRLPQMQRQIEIGEEFRGQGIGKSLLAHLARVAIEHNCGRFQWQVLDWNTPSIRFYESFGARVVKEWLNMRVEGEALKRLASEQS